MCVDLGGRRIIKKKKLIFFFFFFFFFLFFFVFFFFKQKTAYEIHSGDWSSDVCSSDLYEREAWYARESEGFRVTFDENILWRDTDLSLGCGVYGTGILPPGHALMEIKTPGSIPLWMVKALSEEAIRKVSFSKYGRAYQDMYSLWQQEGKNAVGF